MILQTLIRRELPPYRLFFWAAPAVGLLALGASLTPWLTLDAAAERVSLMGFVGAIFGAVLALIHGATTLNRDLAQKRMGFFLARPIGTTSLVAAKFLAGLVAALGVALLTWLPALAVWPRQAAELAPALVALGLMVAIILPLAHGVYTAFSVRTVFLALDAAVALAAGTVAFYAAHQGWLYELRTPFQSPALAILVALPLACLVGAFIQIARARTDPRRGHRALSVTLALGMIPAMGVAWAWTQRMTRADVGQLRDIEVHTSDRRGEWVGLAGTSQGGGQGYASLLLHRPSGHSVRVPNSAGVSYERMTIAPSGKRAAWVTAPWNWGDRQPHLQVAHLAGGKALIKDLGGVEGQPWNLCLSPEGLTVALIYPVHVDFLDALTGVRLHRLPMSVANRGQIRFLDEHTARIYANEDFYAPLKSRTIHVIELDLRNGRTRTTGTLPMTERAWLPQLRFDSENHRLAMQVSEHGVRDLRLLLVDARTGERLAEFPNEPNARGMDILPLSGGRWLRSWREGNTRHFQLLSPQGQPVANWQVPSRGSGWPLMETSDGQVLLAGMNTIRTLDLTSGQVKLVAEHLTPAEWRRVPTPGSLLYLYNTTNGDLLYGMPGGKLDLVAKGQGWPPARP